MEQLNEQNTEKKKWETPKAEVISNDRVKAGSVFGGHEGQHTASFTHFSGIYQS